MSGRRNRSQARRTGRNGMPGWAWLLVGLVVGAGALWAWTSFPAADDDFLRPRPNPDARPVDDEADAPIAAEDVAAAEPATQYDFYTLLPGDGVAMSDEELAASARAEAEAAAARQPGADEATPAAPATTEPATPPRADVTAPDDAARYVLQAGAFASMGDAESVKARIALLGLAARVEPATTGDGQPVYRVRLGPYATAAELADAKRKLADGGLPSLAIRAR